MWNAGTPPATLTGTPGHPFWSVDHQAWVGMHELQPGETLLITTGRTATVTATRTEYLTTPVKIYNFEVADWHTYHVGSPDTGWVWVHNKNCGPGTYAKDTGHMSDAARAFQGKRSYSVPWRMKPSTRSRDVVKFDGWDNKTRELIDRKLNVTTFPKSLEQAKRQARIAGQHNVGVRWEVPADRVNAAENMLKKAVGRNGPIRVVPRKRRP